MPHGHWVPRIPTLFEEVLTTTDGVSEARFFLSTEPRDYSDLRQLQAFDDVFRSLKGTNAMELLLKSKPLLKRAFNEWAKIDELCTRMEEPEFKANSIVDLYNEAPAAGFNVPRAAEFPADYDTRPKAIFKAN